MVVTDAVTVNITSHGAACGCCSCCLATVPPSVGDYTTSDVTTNYTSDMLTTDLPVDENIGLELMLAVCVVLFYGCCIWGAMEGVTPGCGMYVKQNYGGPLGLEPTTAIYILHLQSI